MLHNTAVKRYTKIILPIAFIIAIVMLGLALNPFNGQRPVTHSLEKITFPTGWKQVVATQAVTEFQLRKGEPPHSTARATFIPNKPVNADAFQSMLNQNTTLNFGQMKTCIPPTNPDYIARYNAKAEDGKNIVIISYSPSANTLWVTSGEKSDRTLLPNTWDC